MAEFFEPSIVAIIEAIGKQRATAAKPIQAGSLIPAQARI